MLDERDGFYFHRSFRDAIDQLPQKDQLALYKAITGFGLDGVEPQKLTPTQNAFYLLVRPVLLKGRNKAASGKQGGSRRKQTRSKSEANGKQTESKNESASDLPLSDNNADSDSDKGVILTDYDKGQGSNPPDYDKGRRDNACAPMDGRSFTEFWKAYPAGKGGSREEAWNAWKELNPSTATAWRILDSLKDWNDSEQWAEDGGRFIPNAAKFLREQRWMAPPGRMVCGDNEDNGPYASVLAYANQLIAAKKGGDGGHGE